MNLAQVRGAVLEELVLHLLSMAGYRVVGIGEEGTREVSAGLAIAGRGAWHQADALAAMDFSPPFTYPLRLVVEAKCQKHPVSLPVIRNAVGLQKDVIERFITLEVKVGARKAGTDSDYALWNEGVQSNRFNYQSVVVSTSGFTAPAQQYALAHRIYLFQYEEVGLLRPVIAAVTKIRKKHLSRVATIAGIRGVIRSRLGLDDQLGVNAPGWSYEGRKYLEQEIIEPLLQIEGSYFGVLGGRWPVSLLARREIPENLFRHSDEVRCRLYGYEADRWAFSPIEVVRGDPGYFELQFDLPEEVVRMLDEAGRDRLTVAEIKQGHFSRLDVSGLIGGVRRNVRLVMDQDWIERYRQRFAE